ncbi:MAG: hypothetical protein FJX47_12710 [Alphaproteobacteria bacterium]|nr:hypothetical protein [Alphaproteobacteria bacterium]
MTAIGIPTLRATGRLTARTVAAVAITGMILLSSLAATAQDQAPAKKYPPYPDIWAWDLPVERFGRIDRVDSRMTEEGDIQVVLSFNNNTNIFECALLRMFSQNVDNIISETSCRNIWNERNQYSVIFNQYVSDFLFKNTAVAYTIKKKQFHSGYAVRSKSLDGGMPCRIVPLSHLYSFSEDGSERAAVHFIEVNRDPIEPSTQLGDWCSGRGEGGEPDEIVRTRIVPEVSLASVQPLPDGTVVLSKYGDGSVFLRVGPDLRMRQTTGRAYLVPKIEIDDVLSKTHDGFVPETRNGRVVKYLKSRVKLESQSEAVMNYLKKYDHLIVPNPTWAAR